MIILIIFFYRALCNYQLNKLDEAESDLKKSSDLSTEPEPILFTWRGICKRDLGKYKLALQFHDQAITKDTKNPESFFQRGLTKNAQERYRVAIHDFDKAISLDSENSLFYLNRGISKRILDKKEDAIKPKP